MGLFLFPTGLLTPQKDGLFANWHEDLMLYTADTAAMLSMKAPHRALAATSWGLRAYVYTDRHLIETPNQTQMSPRKIEIGDVRYYLG